MNRGIRWFGRAANAERAWLTPSFWRRTLLLGLVGGCAVAIIRDRFGGSSKGAGSGGSNRRCHDRRTGPRSANRRLRHDRLGQRPTLGVPGRRRRQVPGLVLAQVLRPRRALRHGGRIPTSRPETRGRRGPRRGVPGTSPCRPGQILVGTAAATRRRARARRDRHGLPGRPAGFRLNLAERSPAPDPPLGRRPAVPHGRRGRVHGRQRRVRCRSLVPPPVRLPASGLYPFRGRQQRPPQTLGQSGG